MSYFDFPPGQRVLREFKDNRDPNGRLIAAEAHGLPGGVFDSIDEAERFALWQANGEADRVHIEPGPRHSTRRLGPRAHQQNLVEPL
jgi:hypothetical protein